VSHPIVYVDVSRVRDGKVEELETAMHGLALFVEANMPRVRSYGFFLNEARTTMTVVALHPDSASLELHLDAGTDEFGRFAELIELVRIEVYGRVSRGVLDRLHAKARLLGGGTVAVHDLHAGFAR
jgi:hypothetical protein